MPDKSSNHISPKLLDAYLQSGIALREAGDSPEACDVLRRAVLRDPDSSSAHFALGLTLLDDGKYTEAEIAFKKGSSLLTPDDKSTIAAASFSLGRAQRHLCKYSESASAFQRAIDLGHRSAEVWDLLGEL